MIVKFSPSVDATVEPRHQNQSDTYLSFFFYKIQFFICKKTKSTPNVKCLNTSSKTKTFKSGTIWSKSIDKLQSSIFGICQAENIKGERQLHGHSWPYYKNDCSCWSVASSLLIAVSCFFAVFHLNLIVSTPEAKSELRSCLFKLKWHKLLVCAATARSTGMPTIVSDVCESLHQGQSTITVYKRCRASETRANTSVSTALFKTHLRLAVYSVCPFAPKKAEYAER